MPRMIDVRRSSRSIVAFSDPRFAILTSTLPLRGTSVSSLTYVELMWLSQRIESYTRFGKITASTNIDRSRRVISFSSGSIFAFVRWTANDFGTVASGIDIRPAAAGERSSTVAYVRPGADILLTAMGWPNAEKVLKFIGAIGSNDIDAIEVSPVNGLHAHGRLAARHAPRPYTRQHHQALSLRRRIEL